MFSNHYLNLFTLIKNITITYCLITSAGGGCVGGKVNFNFIGVNVSVVLKVNLAFFPSNISSSRSCALSGWNGCFKRHVHKIKIFYLKRNVKISFCTNLQQYLLGDVAGKEWF
jgi:hypothetical protein